MSDTGIKRPRPKFLHLTQIRLPLPGVVSILHRISGITLFLALPFLLATFDQSLDSADGFAACQANLAHPLVKLTLLALLAGYLYHFCAGIRFLLLDLNKGLDLATARFSSALVIGVSRGLTLLAGVKLL